MKPHKHAELIKAWADGAEIQALGGTFNKSGQIEECWVDDPNVLWHEHIKYRIKPEPKPDIKHHYFADWTSFTYETRVSKQNLILTFDGETGELKSAEVLK